MTRTSTLITSNPVGPNKIELVAMIPGQEGIIHSKKKWVFRCPRCSGEGIARLDSLAGGGTSSCGCIKIRTVGLTLEEAFNRFLKFNPPLVVNKTGCTLWGASIDRDGYGNFSFMRKSLKSHRVALEIKLGRPIAPGLIAFHVCNSPACINPDHLKEATVQENNQYRDECSRTCKGEAHGNAKLTNEKVMQIRDYIAAGIPQRQIAKMFGVSQTTVNDVNTGKIWKHVC